MVVGAGRLLPLGDMGLVVQCGGEEFSDAINAAVRALGRAVADRRLEAVVEVVPTLRSLLVVFDPLRTTAVEIGRALSEVVDEAGSEEPPAGRLIELPVAYGEEFGPDLAAVAQEVGRAESQVIALHADREYRVYMLGFTPGFPYMGALSPSLQVTRLPSPRTRIPRGSVAIAGRMTCVYSVESPGGWSVIGRTPLPIFDPSRRDAFLLEAGDRVRFVPISRDEYARRVPLPVPSSPPAPLRPAVVVEEGGLLTTVQDLGRVGYRRFGLPPAGAMDPLALKVTNLLMGNPPGAAGLEFTFPGPRLRAARPLTLAIGGADLCPTINGRPARLWSCLRLDAGDLLAFDAPRSGRWAYLALPGGVDVPETMGSRATYLAATLGGYAGRRLERGDRFGCLRITPRSMLRLPEHHWPPVTGAAAVRIVLGPQQEYFTEDAVAALLGAPFSVGPESNRVGYRLEGPRLSHRTPVELLSDGLLPGALQVPSGGQPIVIMADGPTTGGYPKIGGIVLPDLRWIAQARRGETIRFQAVARDASHVAAREEAAFLAGVRFEPVPGTGPVGSGSV
jgi:KipI family sensor histidine kinase inhibitor